MTDITIGGMTNAGRSLAVNDKFEIETVGAAGRNLTGQQLIDGVNANSTPTFVSQATNYTVTAADRGKVYLCTDAITITLGSTGSYPANFWIGVVNYTATTSKAVTISTPDQIGWGANTQLVLSANQAVKIFPNSGNWGVLDGVNGGGNATGIFDNGTDTVTLSDVHNRGFVRLSTTSNAKTVTLPDNTSDRLWLGFDCEVYNPSTTAVATITGGTIEGLTTIGPQQSVHIIKRLIGTPNVWVVRGVLFPQYTTISAGFASIGLTTPYSIISVNFGSTGSIVSLCDATLYTLNSNILVVNTSFNAFSLKNNSGTLLVSVGAYQTVQLTVTDNSTSAGQFLSVVRDSYPLSSGIPTVETIVADEKAFLPTSSSPATVNTRVSGSGNNYRYFTFSATGTSQIFTQLTVPKNILQTSFKLIINWISSNANTGNVQFNIAATYHKGADNYSHSFSSPVTLVSAAPGAADTLVTSSKSSSITPSNVPVSQQDYVKLDIQIYRVAASGSDTYNGDAQVIGLGIYMNQTVGNCA